MNLPEHGTSHSEVKHEYLMYLLARSDSSVASTLANTIGGSTSLRRSAAAS